MSLGLEKRLMKKLWIKSKFNRIVVLLITWFVLYKFMKIEDLVGTIYKALPSREAGLLAGMVWGEKKGLTGEFYNLLKNTGLIHIVVVSGANLMIIGKGFIESLAKGIGRKMAIVGGGGVILIYVNLVGWQIPVVRAVLFLGVFYCAQVLGRQFSTMRAIILVGLLMIFADFKVVTNVSFWLSMTAFIAVILTRNEGMIKNTIWVSLFVLPILSLCFGTVSIIAPIMNLGILFLVEVLTILGFVGSLVALFWNNLGTIVLQICYPFLRYLFEAVEGVGKIGGLVNFQFNWWMLFGWYFLLGGYWYEKKKI